MSPAALKICAALISMSMPNAETACEYLPNVIAAAEHHELSPLLLISLIHAESRWNPKAVSRAKACGLTQILPRYSSPRLTCRQLQNPQISIWMGAKTLKKWISEYGNGNERIGLCGYNAGYRCKGSKALRSGLRYAFRIQLMKRKIEKEIRSKSLDQIILLLQWEALESF